MVPQRRRVPVRPRDAAEGNGADDLVGFLDDAGRLLRAVRLGDGGDGAQPGHPRAGGRRASCDPTGSGPTRGSTPPTTCTPGPSCTSRASAGCASSRPPPARANGVPPYTRQRVPEPTGGASDSAGAQPSEELPVRGSPSSAEVAPDSASGSDGDSGAGAVWRRLLLGVLALAGALGLALIPRTVRGARRERRWAGGGRTEDAWAELRDTVVDVGRTWPVGLSPRAAGDRVATWFGRPVDDLTAGPAGDRRRGGPGGHGRPGPDRGRGGGGALRASGRRGAGGPACRRGGLCRGAAGRRHQRRQTPRRLAAALGAAAHQQRREPGEPGTTRSSTTPGSVGGSEAAVVVATALPPLLHALHEGAATHGRRCRHGRLGPAAAVDDGQAGCP